MTLLLLHKTKVRIPLKQFPSNWTPRTTTYVTHLPSFSAGVHLATKYTDGNTNISTLLAVLKYIYNIYNISVLLLVVLQYICANFYCYYCCYCCYGPVAPHVGKRSHISWKTYSQMTPYLGFIGNTVQTRIMNKKWPNIPHFNSTKQLYLVKIIANY